MIVCTAYTMDAFYVSASNRLRESCADVGLPLVEKHLHYVAGDVPRLRQFAYRELVQTLLEVLYFENEPVLLIGCDDYLKFRPVLPDEFLQEYDVGIWRNPELDEMQTHLHYAAQYIVNPTDAGRAFVHLVLHIMDTYLMNDHRAFHAARALGYGLRYKEMHLDQYMQGCVCRTASCVQKQTDASTE